MQVCMFKVYYWEISRTISNWWACEACNFLSNYTSLVPWPTINVGDGKGGASNVGHHILMLPNVT